MRFLIATYAWSLANLPEAFARANAWALSWVLWGLRRKIIRRNLAASFPEKDGAWVRRLGRLSCRRTAEMGLYAIASPRLSEAEIRTRIQIHPELLEGPNSLRGPAGHPDLRGHAGPREHADPREQHEARAFLHVSVRLGE